MPIDQPSAHTSATDPRWLLALALAGWLAATAGVTAWVLRTSLTAIESDFAEYGEHLHARLRDKLRAGEASLHGFAAFAGAMPPGDREAAKIHARAFLDRYPHIRSLDVVRRGEWIAPARPDDEAGASRAAVLRRCLDTQSSASGKVCPLAGNDQGYLLIRPIAPLRAMPAADAVMIVGARDLLPEDERLDAAIAHRLELVVDEQATPLLAIPATGKASAGSLFSALRTERMLDDLSQPLRLTLERPLGIRDVSGIGLATVALASIFSLALLLGYFNDLRRREARRREALRTIEHLALHDTLTGLPNRFLLLGRMDQTLSGAQRSGHHVAVLFLDLDGFKPVNDRYGHHVGDEVLKEIAHRLRACVRDSDTVARHGGDEFVVILDGLHGADEAGAVAAKILQRIAEPVRTEERDLRVTTSIGIALYPDNGGDAETLLRAADAAMYEAKAEGRKVYRFAATALDSLIPQPSET